jgi:hypothetical protein
MGWGSEVIEGMKLDAKIEGLTPSLENPIHDRSAFLGNGTVPSCTRSKDSRSMIEYLKF